MTKPPPDAAIPGQDLRSGKDPLLDAWFLHFMSENHIEHSIDPESNASPEQVRFMVFLGPDGVYVPCSDQMLAWLLDKERPEPLMQAYSAVWKTILELIEGHCQDPFDKMKIMALCDHKYRQALGSPVLIPSRLQKRLTTIVLALSGQDDPYKERKRIANRRASQVIQSQSLAQALNACPEVAMACTSMEDLRFELDVLEIARLSCLSVWSELWERDGFIPSAEDIGREISRLGRFDALRDLMDPQRPKVMKILYLPEESGGVLFDILVVRALVRMGHRVILALKEGFFYRTPTIWDAEDDPDLAQALDGASFLEDNRAAKNVLLQALKENPVLIISDGTRERLNLYRVSVTFARAWKECDLVIAKGEQNYRRLILTNSRFTRDVLCIHRLPDGTVSAVHKPRPSGIRVFTEPEITAKAQAIIARIRSEKTAGKTIMFYSAIVGSIPHETETAVRILSVFVGHLRTRLAGVSVINPAEHFEEGMDADDLMFMWEKVQRSGLLDVWRFQSYEDIELAFELMGRQVPPVWAGKDATYSTGCTKEMRVALDVQKAHPELQIIGPSPEKFFRRREYGVGKFFDAAIAAR